MKRALVICLVFMSFVANSTDLPKGLVGQYFGEMEAFDFVHNDKELSASSHEIEILFTENGVLYSTGTMEYRGEYQFVAQDDKKYIIKTKMTNDLSMSFELKLIYDKKTKTVTLDGDNGIPDTSLAKRTA
ncbi:MAG: hypothetical protein ABJG68_01155 [Crocinitomicaceae bacterium]